MGANESTLFQKQHTRTTSFDRFRVYSESRLCVDRERFQPRAVFVSLYYLSSNWETIPVDVLHHSLLIFHCRPEWVFEPESNGSEKSFKRSLPSLKNVSSLHSTKSNKSNKSNKSGKSSKSHSSNDTHGKKAVGVPGFHTGGDIPDLVTPSRDDNRTLPSFKRGKLNAFRDSPLDENSASNNDGSVKRTYVSTCGTNLDENSPLYLSDGMYQKTKEMVKDLITVKKINRAFKAFLKHKESQGRLLWIDPLGTPVSATQRWLDIDPKWNYVSEWLGRIRDPITGGYYQDLITNFEWWTTKYDKSVRNVVFPPPKHDAEDIVTQIEFCMDAETICHELQRLRFRFQPALEILHQSNTTLIPMMAYNPECWETKCKAIVEVLSPMLMKRSKNVLSSFARDSIELELGRDSSSSALELDDAPPNMTQMRARNSIPLLSTRTDQVESVRPRKIGFGRRDLRADHHQHDLSIVESMGSPERTPSHHDCAACQGGHTFTPSHTPMKSPDIATPSHQHGTCMPTPEIPALKLCNAEKSVNPPVELSMTEDAPERSLGDMSLYNMTPEMRSRGGSNGHSAMNRSQSSLFGSSINGANCSHSRISPSLHSIDNTHFPPPPVTNTPHETPFVTPDSIAPQNRRKNATTHEPCAYKAPMDTAPIEAPLHSHSDNLYATAAPPSVGSDTSPRTLHTSNHSSVPLSAPVSASITAPPSGHTSGYNSLYGSEHTSGHSSANNSAPNSTKGKAQQHGFAFGNKPSPKQLALDLDPTDPYTNTGRLARSTHEELELQDEIEVFDNDIPLNIGMTSSRPSPLGIDRPSLNDTAIDRIVGGMDAGVSPYSSNSSLYGSGPPQLQQSSAALGGVTGGGGGGGANGSKHSKSRPSPMGASMGGRHRSQKQRQRSQNNHNSSGNSGGTSTATTTIYEAQRSAHLSASELLAKDEQRKADTLKRLEKLRTIFLLQDEEGFVYLE